MRVRRDRMHSTLYAVAKIPGLISGFDTMRESARFALDRLNDCNFVSLIRDALQGCSFIFKPQTINVYRNDTTIQFGMDDDNSQRLTDLRNKVFGKVVSMGDPFRGVAGVEFPLDGVSKNRGSNLFGSIARNPVRVENSENILQQRIRVPARYQNTILAQKAILTISDETLGNHFEVGDFHDISLR